MKSARLLAASYAEALSRVVTDDAELARAWDDLRALERVIGESSELSKVLHSPAVKTTDKQKVLHALSERMGLKPAALHLIQMLAAHGTLVHLREVASAVGAAFDRKSGTTEVTITSAQPLDDATRAKLHAALERSAGGKVRITESVDAALIGGVMVKIGATVYDGSLRTKLEKMRSRLAG
jgi:F-type H+-transporting ATPase subunit delta